jgi:hypothetical protein
MPVHRNSSCIRLASANAPVSANAPAPAVQAQDNNTYIVSDDEFRRLATIRHRHNEAIARHTSALCDARDAFCDALRALEDTEYNAHAEMDAALPLRALSSHTDEDRIGVETLLPDIDPTRDALQVINHFVGTLRIRVDTIQDSDPVHMLLVPRERMAAYARVVLRIPNALFNLFHRDWHPVTHDHRTGLRHTPQLCSLGELRFTPKGSWIIHNDPATAIRVDDSDDDTIAPSHHRRARSPSPTTTPTTHNNRRRRLFRTPESPSTSSTERYANEPGSPSDHAAAERCANEPGSPSD